MNGEEDTPSLVVDNLRPDHVGGSAAMVIDGKEARSPGRQVITMSPEEATAHAAVIEAARDVDIYCAMPGHARGLSERLKLRRTLHALDARLPR